MPMLFWFPFVIMSEMWCMAWIEKPSLVPRPRSLTSVINSPQVRDILFCHAAEE